MRAGKKSGMKDLRWDLQMDIAMGILSYFSQVANKQRAVSMLDDMFQYSSQNPSISG